MTSFTRRVAVGLAALLCFVLLGCDTGGSSPETSANCDSRTGNAMTATVNGDAICTDLGTAMLSDATGTPLLSVIGFFGNLSGTSGHSIDLHVERASTGTFALLEGGYSTEDESVYFIVNDQEGSGSITITEMSDTRVKGTFDFTAIGIDASTGNPSGEQARVTNGAFDFALGN